MPEFRKYIFVKAIVLVTKYSTMATLIYSERENIFIRCNYSVSIKCQEQSDLGLFCLHMFFLQEGFGSGRRVRVIFLSIF